MKVNKPLLLICLFIVIAYLPVLFGFFQQDEWLGYARHLLLEGSSTSDLLSYAFSPSSGHYIPFTLLSVFTIFSLFNLNYLLFAFLSISLHLFTAFLVYKIGTTLFDKRLSLVSALIFGVLAAPYQATSWVVADVGTHMSTIFALLSLLLFARFIKSGKQKLGIASAFFLVLSFLFKELAVGLLIVYPIILAKTSKSRRLLGVFIALIVVFIAIRGGMILAAPSKNEPLGGVSRFQISTMYNIVTSPPRTIVQLIIPEPALKKIAFAIANVLPEEFVGEKGTPFYDIHVNKFVTEFVIAVIFLVLAIFYLKLLQSKKKSRLQLILGVFLIVVNSLVYAISSGGQNGRIIFIDPRNLYLVSVFLSILLGSLIAKRKFLIAIVIIWNIFWLEETLLPLASVGSTRASILQDIMGYYPRLFPTTIFYTESNSSYYGLASNERILPFQSGFGQTLLSWYSQSENLPKSFFENRFLWEIREEGYRSHGVRGFGYFRSFEKMAKVVRDQNLPISSVIGLRYDAKSGVVTPMTDEIKGRLNGYMSDKKLVSSSDYKVESVYNASALLNTVDNNRDTSWSSGVPYSNAQEIAINFSNPKKISQLTIDSYRNKDQNEVGYAIATSKDGYEWREIMRVERITPDEDGLVRLYLRPDEIQMMRIVQIGYHEYASWEIHELAVYETTSQ